MYMYIHVKVKEESLLVKFLKRYGRFSRKVILSLFEKKVSDAWFIQNTR